MNNIESESKWSSAILFHKETLWLQYNYPIIIFENNTLSVSLSNIWVQVDYLHKENRKYIAQLILAASFTFWAIPM